MAEPLIWVFFYGSYINLDVLREVDLVPARYEVAVLSGFEIAVAPLANLHRSDRATVYGILATATHRELDRLYTDHAQGVLGGTYLPEAVLTRTLPGSYRPALCYIAHEMPPGPADPAYLRRIVTPARELGFPDWYLAHLKSFE